MKTQLKRELAAMATGIALVLCASAPAAAAVFDFETTASGDYGSSLTLSNDGLLMTITRFGGTDVVVGSASYPASWGTQALYPFNDTNGGAYLLTFSSAITSISVDVGDFAPSDADTFSVTAGSLTASGSQSGSTGFPVFSTLTLTGFSSTTAVLSGGSADFPQSVFWDNINVTAVPEPASYALMAAGLAAVGAFARKRRSDA